MTDSVDESALDLADLASQVMLPDEDARAAALARQATVTKPAGSLGRLEELSVWLCGVQGVCPPRPIAQPRLVIFAGDHGVATTAGTSACASSTWPSMSIGMRSAHRSRPI